MSIELEYDLNRACLSREALKPRRFPFVMMQRWLSMHLSRSINEILARLSYDYLRLLRWPWRLTHLYCEKGSAVAAMRLAVE